MKRLPLKLRPPRPAIYVGLLGLGLIAPLLLSEYVVGDVLVGALIWGLLAVSLDVAWGYGGILSLGHGALFGAGAYTTSILVVHWASPFATGVGVVLGIVVPAVLGAAIGALLFYNHASELYVAVLTLSASLLLPQLLLRAPELTGGSNGLSGIPPFPFDARGSYYLVLGIALVVLIVSHRVMNSDFGTLLKATKENEARASALGYRTPRVRTLAFAISGLIAGVAAVLFPFHSGFVSQTLPGFATSTSAIVWVAIGGRGSLVGPFVAAVLVSWFTPALNATWPHFWQLGLGIAFVLAVVFFRGGLISLTRGRDTGGIAELDTDYLVAPALGQRVTIEGLNVSYGSVSVLQNLSIELSPRSLHGLIGPNGAGKSTLVRTIAGEKAPDKGSIQLGGFEISGLDPARVSRRGMGRTFQTPSLFDTLTVGDNLLLAHFAGHMPSLVGRTRVLRLPTSVMNALEQSGLERRLGEEVSALSHGERKWLEIVLVMASAPSVVLLDEPTAGLTSDEREVARGFLRNLADSGLSVLLIEHDMSFVRAAADEVSVLMDGEVVLNGTVEEVLADERVKEAYLGAAT